MGHEYLNDHNFATIGPILENVDILNNHVRVRSNFGTLVRYFKLNCYAITPDHPEITAASIQTQGFIDHRDNSLFFVLVLVFGYFFLFFFLFRVIGDSVAIVHKL